MFGFRHLVIALGALALAACGSRDPQTAPSEPAIVDWGVTLPPGTRHIADYERPVFDGANSVSHIYASTSTMTEALVALRRQGVDADAHDPCVSVADVRACAGDVAEVPEGADAASAPPGTRSWITLHRTNEPAPCPECPEGFVGTLVPGCTCAGDEAAGESPSP